VQEIEEVQTVKAEPREQASYQESQSYAGGNQESAVALEDGYQEEYGDYAQYEGQYDAIDPNTGLPIADGNKALLNSMMASLGSGRWQCTECGFTSKSTNVRYHIESKHAQSTEGYDCPLCDYHSKTRNGINTHMSSKHKPPALH